MKQRPEKFFSLPVSGSLVYGNAPAIENYVVHTFLPRKLGAVSDEVKFFEEAELLQISKKALYFESGLFGAPKLYIVHNVTDKFLPLLEAYNQETPLVMVGKNLKSSSKIVAYMSQHPKYNVFPIYDNDAAVLNAFAQHELSAYALEGGVLHLLLTGTFSFTQLQQAIKNIQQAYSTSEQLTKSHIEPLLPQASSATLFELADLLLSKNASALMQAFYKDNTVLEKEPIPFVRIVSKQLWDIVKLLQATEKGKTPDQAISTLSPPLHFKRKPLVLAALSRWKLSSALKAIVGLDELEIQLKQSKGITLDFLERSFVQIAKL